MVEYFRVNVKFVLIAILILLSAPIAYSQNREGQIISDAIALGSGSSIPLPPGKWLIKSNKTLPGNNSSFNCYYLENQDPESLTPYIFIQIGTTPRAWRQGKDSVYDVGGAGLDMYGTLNTSLTTKISTYYALNQRSRELIDSSTEYPNLYQKMLSLGLDLRNIKAIDEKSIVLSHINIILTRDLIRISTFIKLPDGYPSPRIYDESKSNIEDKIFRKLKAWNSIATLRIEQAYLNKKPQPPLFLSYADNIPNDEQVAITANDNRNEESAETIKQKEKLLAETKAKAEQLEKLAEQTRLDALAKAKEEKIIAENKAKEDKLAQEKLKEQQKLDAISKAKEQERIATEAKNKELERLAADLREKERLETETKERDRLIAAAKARDDQIEAEKLKAKQKIAAETRAREEERVAREAKEAKIKEQERLAAEAREKEIKLAQDKVKEQQKIEAETKIRESERLKAEALAREKERQNIQITQISKEDQLAQLTLQLEKLKQEISDAETKKIKPFVVGRKALVIGNNNYKNVAKLVNADADAALMAENLKQVGYDVTLKLDVTQKELLSALRTFKAQVGPGDEITFFYAGHGVQLGQSNFILPTDIDGESEDQIKDDAVPLERVLEDMAEKRAKFTLAIVDACRDNPFKTAKRSIGGSRGLAPTSTANGQMIVFSAGAGQQALDNLGPNDKNKNSVFTRVFIKEMQKPGQSIDKVVRNVRNEVVDMAKSVNHEQVPAIYDQVIGEFYFKK